MGEEIEAPIVLVNKITTDLEKLIKKDYKKITLKCTSFYSSLFNKRFSITPLQMVL